MLHNDERLPIFVSARATKNEFVRYWAAWYSYPAEGLYDSNIGRPLTPERLRALFEWKNGRRLSAAKLRSVDSYAGRCTELVGVPATISPQDFYRRFGGGPIWCIFLLHCRHPDYFPIYDQHVHRGMRFLETSEIHELPPAGVDVLAAYTTEYLPFWRTFPHETQRLADKALWAFGKFLSLYPHCAKQPLAGWRLTTA